MTSLPSSLSHPFSHPLTRPLSGPLGYTVSRLRAWPVESQLGARRNAMVASTALAARRAEREDVDAYLAARTPRDQVVQALPR